MVKPWSCHHAQGPFHDPPILVRYMAENGTGNGCLVFFFKVVLYNPNKVIKKKHGPLYVHINGDSCGYECGVRGILIHRGLMGYSWSFTWILMGYLSV